MGIVQVASKCTILPKFENTNKDPPSPIHYYISNLDILHGGNAYTNSVWLFGPPHATLPSSSPHADFILSLKSSMAQFLSLYPWLAGRIIFSKEDNRPYLCSNHAGITFVEANVDASLDECKLDNSFLKCLAPLGNSLIINDYRNSPLLMFQITTFRCGSYSIGKTAMDLLGDGLSYSNMFVAWSEFHRGLPISFPLYFDGNLFKPRDPPMQLMSHDRDYIAVQLKDEMEEKVQCFEYSSVKKPLISKTFTLTSQQVTELVKEVELPGPFHYEKVTSFEATAAFLWKSITQARELPDDVITRYCYPINLRQYMDPPLSCGYFGRTIHYPSLPARAGDIKANHISYAARLIHQDLKQIRNNAKQIIKSLVDWVEIEIRKGNQVGYNMGLTSGTDIHSTYLMNFPFCEVDFGYGPPLHCFMTIHEDYGDGVAFVMPTKDKDRSRKLSIQLPPHHMKKLLSTDLFSRFFPIA